MADDRDALNAAIDADAEKTSADPLSSAIDSEFQEIQQEHLEDKYGGMGQQAITALEGAADVATFGAATGISQGLGLTTAEDQAARREINPGSRLVGEIGGLAATSFIPGVGAANVLGKAGSAAAMATEQAITQGVARSAGQRLMAGIGSQAVRGAVESTLFQGGEEVSRAFIEDPVQVAESAAAHLGLAFVMGGMFGGALGAASEGLKGLSPAIEGLQERAGAKALGFTKGQIKKLKGGQDEAKEIARTLMDAEIESGEKIFTPLAGAEDLAAGVEKLRVSAGNRMGKVYEALDSNGAPSVKPIELASKIDEQLGKFWRSPINKGESNQLENILESVLIRGDEALTFRDAQLLKEEIRKVAYPNGKSPLEPTPRIQIAQDAYRIVNKEIDLAVDSAAKELGDGSLLKQLQLARKEYGAAKKAGKAIADRISSEQGNKLFGLTDTIAGTAIGAGAGMGPAAVAVAAKKLAEKYGATAIASSKDAYLDGLNRFVSAFGVNTEVANAKKLADAAVKSFQTMDKAAKSIFDAKAALPSNVIPMPGSADKLSKVVADIHRNPEKLLAINDNNPVPDYSEGFASTAARAATYLAALKPQIDPKAPLDAKGIVSAPQNSKYNRALAIAQQPLIVMGSIKQGTLTSFDVVSLRAIYPGLYQQMAQKITNEMINATAKGMITPYGSRLALSLFLGQPVDSSFSGASILAAQPKPKPKEQSQVAQGPGTPNRAPAASSMKGLSKMPQQARTPAQAAEMSGAQRDK